MHGLQPKGASGAHNRDTEMPLDMAYVPKSTGELVLYS